MFKRLFGFAKQSDSPAAETTTSLCSISLVQGGKEFDILGPLILEATQGQKIETILFSRGKPGAEDAEKGQVGFSVWGKDQDLTSRSWNASALNDKEKVVGMCTISYHEGEIPDYQPPDPAAYKYKPPTVRVDFLTYMNGEYNRLRQKHLNGVKHVGKYCILLLWVDCSSKSDFLTQSLRLVWESLYTLPGAQAKAIGEDLVRWGFQHFNLARETIFTFTEDPELFANLGWKQVDVLEVDPQPWVGSEESDLKTFQVFVLVRKPGELSGAVVEAAREK